MVGLVLAAVVLVVQARVVLGGKTWDDIRYHTQVAPGRYAAATAVQRGELPQWWDGSGLGVPLVGEPSHGAAYPLHWIAGTPRVLELVLILHLLWAALGVAVWARRLGTPRLGEAELPRSLGVDLGALVGGVLVVTSGVLASAALRGSLPALAHVPWIAWAASQRKHVALGALIGLVGLAGELGVLVDCVALALVVGLGVEIVHVDVSRARARLALAIACGLAIGAMQWIPAALAIPHMAGATLHGIPVARLVELVVPGRFGDVAAIGGAHAWFPSVYIGAPLLALAVLARPRRRVTILLALLAVAVLVVGRGGWPAWLGAPEQHLAVIAIIAAAHAAIGFDVLLSGERRGLFAMAGWALLALIGVIALGVLRGRVEGHDAEVLSRALLDGGIAVGCMAAAALVAWRLREGTRTLLLIVLVIAPGVGAQPAVAPVTDRSIVDTPPLWVEKALASPAPVRVFRPVRLFGDVHDTTRPTLDGELATFTGASSSLWGVDAARSEDPARIDVHDQVWLAAASAGGQLLARYGIALAILPLASVEGKGLVELGRRGSWALVRYPASPPAAVVYEWIFADDLATQLARLFPPGAHGLPPGLVVLHGRGAENQDEPSPPEACTIASWTDGAIDLDCNARMDAYAVVASTPMPGWSARDDDHDVPWLTADVLRRAVPVTAGAHRIAWRYRAPGLLVGFVLAMLGILGMGALHLGRRRE